MNRGEKRASTLSVEVYEQRRVGQASSAYRYMTRGEEGKYPRRRGIRTEESRASILGIQVYEQRRGGQASSACRYMNRGEEGKHPRWCHSRTSTSTPAAATGSSHPLAPSAARPQLTQRTSPSQVCPAHACLRQQRRPLTQTAPWAQQAAPFQSLAHPRKLQRRGTSDERHMSIR